MSTLVTFTIGIPASGKSTWAKEEAARTCAYISNRDDLRAELFCDDGDINSYKFSKEREAKVSECQMSRILLNLSADRDIIISDTNLNPERRGLMRHTLRMFHPQTTFVNKEFETSLKTCIKRNLKRHASVPESVLIRMEMQMREHLCKVRYSPDGRLDDSCIIVDIDGTIADMKGVRGPYEWSRVGEDNAIMVNIELVTNYISNANGVKIIFFSGRDGSCRDETIRWLNKYFCDYQLYMRQQGSNASDDVVKECLYIDHVHGKYNVDFVMDDRKQVVQMWESIGLNVINVGGTLSDF